jgi:hypothetical protein
MSEKNERYLRQVQKELEIYIPPTKFDRQFLGKLKDFEDKDEQRKENKHLKAYLKGLEKFTYGFETITDEYGRVSHRPKVYNVKFELIDLTDKV